jgi:hypothetical protein
MQFLGMVLKKNLIKKSIVLVKQVRKQKLQGITRRVLLYPVCIVNRVIALFCSFKHPITLKDGQHFGIRFNSKPMNSIQSIIGV